MCARRRSAARAVERRSHNGGGRGRGGCGSGGCGDGVAAQRPARSTDNPSLLLYPLTHLHLHPITKRRSLSARALLLLPQVASPAAAAAFIISYSRPLSVCHHPSASCTSVHSFSAVCALAGRVSNEPLSVLRAAMSCALPRTLARLGNTQRRSSARTPASIGARTLCRLLLPASSLDQTPNGALIKAPPSSLRLRHTTPIAAAQASREKNSKARSSPLGAATLLRALNCPPPSGFLQASHGP